MAQPGVTALDLDVLRRRALLFKASLPRDDTVGTRVDCRARHRRRELHRFPPGPIAGGAPAQGFVEPPGVARLRLVGERAAERNHLAHLRRSPPRQLPRKHAAEAPANEADLALIAFGKFSEPRLHTLLHAGSWAMVRALLPTVRCITLLRQIGAEWARRSIARGKTGQHDHWMTITTRCQSQQRVGCEERLQFQNAAQFEPQ